MGRNIDRGIKRRAERQTEDTTAYMLRRVDLQGILTNNKMAQDELEAMGDEFDARLDKALKSCGPQKRRLMLEGLKEKTRGAPRLVTHPDFKGKYILKAERRASATPIKLLDFINQYGKL